MDFICRELPGCRKLVYAWFEAMHTRIDLLVWDDLASVEAIMQLCHAAERETARLEQMGSCFIPESEVSMINMTPVGEEATGISEEMSDIFSRCVAYNKSSAGYFDVTAISGRPTCTSDNLELKNGTVIRRQDDVRVNLSGFLKGYALDRVAGIFSEADIHNALISFGTSSVYALGNHPSGEGWIVETVSGETYCLKDSCLTTSGNADEHRKHIINPLTGIVIEGKGMVSVVTPNAEEGEVQSTVQFIRNNT